MYIPPSDITLTAPAHGSPEIALSPHSPGIAPSHALEGYPPRWIPPGAIFLKNNYNNSMQAIILAAGKGTRLGALTEYMPKPMISMGGKPLLAHIIERLPKTIDEVFIAIGYHGETIRDHFQKHFDGRNISYIDASDLTGTGGALFKARDVLRGKFLVTNGDDLFETEDWERLLQYELSMGVYEGALGFPGYWQIEADTQGMLQRFRKPTAGEIEKGIRIASGSFALDERIFTYEPVRIRSGEYGLPQTALKMAQDYPVALVNAPSWRTITKPEDIDRMEEYLASSG
jgi:UDP-N-acetylglucosamine diphosphorylase / glucose-1-phosphate thymidylyltransferase / UDP-N-acetylgalactosamine diphosphorylase / glucosamine-1-phosphate N-acetyltransferase / galactosamine-1-phosphate N-acetyltransferase